MDLILTYISFTSIFLPCIVVASTVGSSPYERTISSVGKAGLAWPNGPNANIGQYTSTGIVQWYYTWSPDGFPSSLEFVPMLWGSTQFNDWDDNINNTVKNLHVTHALGFNEPEQSSQSNLSPSDAATLWKQHIEPLKSQGILLGSPAPSSAPSGKSWLLQWLEDCDGGCTVDFIALHWYDINSTAFMEYLDDFHATFNRSLWVTEWACQNYNNASDQCSQQDVVNFMNATQQFMDQTSWVERYAWFGAFEDLQGVNQYDALMDPSGDINALGEQYIGAITPFISPDYQPGVVHGGNGSTSGQPVSNQSCSYRHFTVHDWFIHSAVLLILLTLF